MFENLQKKWRVTPLQLLLIIITFAIAGSLTGYVGKKLLDIAGIHHGWLWILLYIVIIILLWPIAVILISFLTGQSKFFTQYVRRIGRDMGIIPKKQVRSIAIFASGAGS